MHLLKFTLFVVSVPIAFVFDRAFQREGEHQEVRRIRITAIAATMIFGGLAILDRI